MKMLILIIVLLACTLSPQTPMEPVEAKVKVEEKLTAKELISKLDEANAKREKKLKAYTELRTYQLQEKTKKGLTDFTVTDVKFNFTPPSKKTFAVIKTKGSWIGRKKVFLPLLQTEVKADDNTKKLAALSFINYDITLLPEKEKVAEVECYRVSIKPKGVNQEYLFTGDVWIHATEWAIIKVAGQPVKLPSDNIKSLTFERTYKKFEDQWVADKDVSHTSMNLNILQRIFASPDFVLKVMHNDYTLK